MEEGMATTRRKHGAAFKAKVALEAAKEQKTLNELAAIYGVHSIQISKWKKELLTALPSLFCRDNKAGAIWEKEKNELYRQIGEVTVERDWLKKKLQTLT
jgi:transposase